MNVERIFKDTKMFSDIKMDVILVEGKYPVLFTCRDKNDTYLFVCCLVTSKIIKWIGTKIKCETLVLLLKNEITIRNAFLQDYEEKLLIEYSGIEKNISAKSVDKKMLPENLLPTEGEYMDAEEDEFEEEIQIFLSRIQNFEYVIKPKVNRFLLVDPCKRTVALTDEFYNSIFEPESGNLYAFHSKCQISAAYV